MTLPSPPSIAAIKPLIKSICDAPDPKLRILAAAGLMLSLPRHDEDAFYEMGDGASLADLSWVEEEIDAVVIHGDDVTVTIDPADQLPRLEFLELMEAAMTLTDRGARVDALTAAVSCALGTSDWVAW